MRSYELYDVPLENAQDHEFLKVGKNHEVSAYEFVDGEFIEVRCFSLPGRRHPNFWILEDNPAVRYMEFFLTRPAREVSDDEMRAAAVYFAPFPGAMEMLV